MLCSSHGLIIHSCIPFLIFPSSEEQSLPIPTPHSEIQCTIRPLSKTNVQDSVILYIQAAHSPFMPFFLTHNSKQQDVGNDYEESRQEEGYMCFVHIRMQQSHYTNLQV